MTERCDCCELPVESCGRAAERRARAAAATERQRIMAIPGVLLAQWPGTCGGCDGWFAAGTPIRNSADGWRAECCL